MFASFSPLMMLLWIAALAMIFGIVFVITFSACATAYYNAKDAHWSKWIRATGKALESIQQKMKKEADDMAEMRGSVANKLDELIKKIEKDRKESGHE